MAVGIVWCLLCKNINSSLQAAYWPTVSFDSIILWYFFLNSSSWTSAFVHALWKILSCTNSNNLYRMIHLYFTFYLSFFSKSPSASELGVLSFNIFLRLKQDVVFVPFDYQPETGYPSLYSIQQLLLLTYISGEGNGYPLQYSCLENPMDGGA